MKRVSAIAELVPGVVLIGLGGAAALYVLGASLPIAWPTFLVLAALYWLDNQKN